MLHRVGFILVFLMAALQAAYAVYAYIDPQAFALLRGTVLFDANDSDWVQIYASRTLFVSLIIGVLLFYRHYKLLIWAALIGTAMPITDALLAYQAGAASGVVYKHIATVVYLLVTISILFEIVRRDRNA